MGQIYYACIYDIENRTACMMESDKFHANCYSYSGAVAAAHYLLRQKPHHVMWGGDYVVLNDAIKDIEDDNILLGLSTYQNLESFERNNDNIAQKSYYDKIKFIDENNKTWSRISVWNEAIEYFDLEKTRSVPYNGYLINHTKKLAVDLADYHMKARFLGGKQSDLLMAIDPIPVLTDTGGGAQMAYFNGVSAISTEKLARSGAETCFKSWTICRKDLR